MSAAVRLPDVDIWAPDYIRISKLCDRCTFSPDKIDGVYFGNACMRHDADCEFINQQSSFFTRWRLQVQADRRLHDGILDAFIRAGKTERVADLISDTYKIGVRSYAWTYRIFHSFF